MLKRASKFFVSLTRQPIMLLLLLLLLPPGAASLPAGGSELRNLEMATGLVQGVARYDVLLPPGYGEQAPEPYPLLVWLHGGSDGAGQLQARLRPQLESAWDAGIIQPLVVVAPITGDSYFIDWKDGAHRWETFILKELVPHMRSHYRVAPDRRGTVIAGASAGGQGTLRIALRNPELFIGAAAMEPGFPPVTSFADIDLTPYGPGGRAFLAERFGDPFDEAYWRARHPPAIVIDQADRLRASGLQLLVEAGDLDANRTFLSAELLHRLLFDAAVPHEYRLVRGAAHTGRSIPARLRNVFGFLDRALNPGGPDPAAERHLLGAKRKGRWSPRTTNQLRYETVEFEPPSDGSGRENDPER